MTSAMIRPTIAIILTLNKNSMIPQKDKTKDKYNDRNGDH